VTGNQNADTGKSESSGSGRLEAASTRVLMKSTIANSEAS
jgi:hypothetical protein